MRNTHVTKETIMNLLVVELSIINEPFIDAAIEGAADYIMDCMDVSNVGAIAESIRDYIFNTKMNYPYYFRTGECNC